MNARVNARVSARVGSSPRVRVTPARVAAAEILTDLRGGTLLDAAFDRRTSGLDARDRRWVQELVWGLLRRRNQLDALLAPRITGGFAILHEDVLDLLRLGVAQLQYMGSVPVYAAIAQTVELVKQRHGIGASKLANAVLRRIARESAADPLPEETLADPLDALALHYSHPRWIVGRWVARFGLADAEALLAANNAPAPIVVRPYGVASPALAAMLAVAGVGTHEVSLVPDSLALDSGVLLTELAAFQSGQFFVQDPAATLVARYADIPMAALVADLCAAPGGKALELARRASLVVACDRSVARADRMLTGMGRVNAPNVQTVVADATAPAVTSADVVLVDVPCTGTGTYRRHPDARWRLKISDFAVLGMTQRAILQAAATVVVPGGLLIYSTCSLEPEENDDVVDAFLRTHPDFVLEPPALGAVPETVLDAGRLRVLPQRHGTDGAFAARMRRRGAGDTVTTDRATATEAIA